MRPLIIKIHLIFWGLVLLVLAVSCISAMSDNNPADVFWGYFIRVFFRVFVFYSFYLTLPQNFIGVKKIFVFIVPGLLFLGLITLLFNYFFLNALTYLTGKTFTSEEYKFMYFDLLISNFNYAVLGTLFRAAKEWYIKFTNKALLERQNVSNKLALLRAQVDPHFLFNTLNNINSFIQQDPVMASCSIKKLKSILKYMLAEASSPEVFLEQEIDLINNYIDLQKVRYADPRFIEFNIEGNFTGVAFPPLLFMPFIENAFKHGKKEKECPGIIINISINKDRICFNTVNFISANNNIPSAKGGFGLKNIKQRLDLLFHNNYILDISNSNEKFLVYMEINR